MGWGDKPKVEAESTDTKFKEGNKAGKGAPAGNKNAIKVRNWRRAIDGVLAEKGPDALRAIARKLITMAENGDIKAIKELGNRLDGAVAQQIELRNPAGENGEAEPVIIQIVGYDGND